MRVGSAISWEIVCVRGMHYMSEACIAAASSISRISSYRRAPPRLSVPLGLGSSVARRMGYTAGACSGRTFVAVEATVIPVVIVVVAIFVIIVVASTVVIFTVITAVTVIVAILVVIVVIATVVIFTAVVAAHAVVVHCRGR